MRGAIARLRRGTLWGLPIPDVVLAGVLCPVAVASVLTGNPDEGALSVTLPVAVVSTLALAWRRNAPAITIALLVVTGMAQTTLAQTPGSLWSLTVYVIAMYSLGMWSSESVAAVVGAVFVAALLVQERLASGVDYVFILLLFGAVWLLGRAARHWRWRVTTAEQRQLEAGRLAAVEERLRIARDLHDVVAHSLGAIAVQADAAEAALQADPDRAIEPVRAIRETARGALDEIRQALGVLRTDEEPRSPGIGSLQTLVEASRASGMTVRLDLPASRIPLPPALEIACYRIAQEALTNARRHAPGAGVTVSVVPHGGTVRVEIVNNAPGVGNPATADSDGSGYGIRGMRERVTALGGRLIAVPTAAGGFRVCADLPLDEGVPR